MIWLNLIMKYVEINNIIKSSNIYSGILFLYIITLMISIYGIRLFNIRRQTKN
jgi:hypothetical protein